MLGALGDDRRGKRGRGDQRRAPRRRGYSVAATGRISVSAAAGVSARSASAARTVGFDEVPRQRDFAADVDARRIEHVDHRGEPEAEVARRGFERGRGLRVARRAPRDQVFDGEVALLGALGARSIRRAARSSGPASPGSRRTPPSSRSIRTNTAARRATAARGRTRRRCCGGRAGPRRGSSRRRRRRRRR